MIHFMVLGAILFAIDHYLSSFQKETIIVSSQTIEFLIKQKEEYQSSKISAKQRNDLIDGYITEEILYREAYNLGLDKNVRMRNNLLRIMRGLEASKIGNPSDKDIQRYYELNRSSYMGNPSWSLEQIYFKDAADVPSNILEQLGAGLDPNSVGDLLSGTGFLLQRVPQQRLAFLFGPFAARAIEKLDDQKWHGPYKSSRGFHLVRVFDSHPSKQREFEEVAHLLDFDWRRRKMHKAIAEKVKFLRKNYSIEIEDPGSGQ